jgi:Glycosyl hydrolases family 2, sugar binding domain/Glycosyl hydrolases family 2/Glycosyl hydrolases family 2, TIM barrel domain
LPVILILFFSSVLIAARDAQIRAPADTAKRSIISLNGDWHFLADPSGELKLKDLAASPNVRPIHVPSSWQMQFADLCDYSGVAWYWRSFNAPSLSAGQVALIHFGAVDYRAEVFVNGRLIGSHDGGYLPFEFDVTSLLRPGENQIVVRVADPGPKQPVDGINYAEIPHGKQNWYVENSGIWQSVELEILPKTHFGVVHITAEMDGNFSVQARVVSPPAPGNRSADLTARAEIHGPDGKLVWEAPETVEPEKAAVHFSAKLSNPALWSPDHPALYTLRLQLESGDINSYRFGFRSFTSRNGKFYLNGKVIYLRGALDQAFYPDTGYVPPSLDFLVAEMKKAKAVGLNLLRCHIKVPDPRYFQAADEAGVLVWYEIPNWDELTPDSESRALDTLRGMARRDWNHPSIVQVSIINESWGADLKKAADRTWLKRTYEEAKELVPWHVDDNSPCCNNFHLATDIADFHNYDAVPDHAADFDRFVSDLATRPRWLFSPYGDASPKGHEPLFLSEFGNWGLPVVPVKRPWWFSRSLGGNKFTLPEGFEDRFHEYGYASLFPSLQALSEATEWHEFQALSYEIGSLRIHPEIQGYVITEFADTAWESNGLYGLWRNPKVFDKELAALQQDDMLILRARTRNFYPGSTAVADVYFSHYSSRPADGAAVRWQIDGTAIHGSLALHTLAPGTAARVGQIKFTVPEVSVPRRQVLRAEIILNGQTSAKNSLKLFFYPQQKLELPPPVSFHDPEGQLRRLVSEMRKRGYQAPSGQEAFPVLIASTFDQKVKQELQSGGRVILLPAGAQKIAPGVEVVPRKGDLSGDWISDFPWVRKESPPFERICFGTLQGFESEAITPETLVRGVPANDFGDVMAGLFYGWIRDNVGTLVQARYSKGRLLICTFSLAASYGTDPYATTFLDALVNYAASDFHPQWQISP